MKSLYIKLQLKISITAESMQVRRNFRENFMIPFLIIDEFFFFFRRFRFSFRLQQKFVNVVKVCEKEHIVREKKQEYVNREKEALNLLSNTKGIISLSCTFQGGTRHNSHNNCDVHRALTFMTQIICCCLFMVVLDTKSLYFVLTFAPNGEILKLIRKQGCFSVATARFYASELLCAIENMARKNIIHR